MIGRIVWTAALIGVGALTAGLQLDRQALIDPSIAPLVPAPFRSYAQAPLAAAALTGRDTAAALAEAETLVRRRPIPAEHLTILAVAQAKAGDLGSADFSIQIASQRGWRDPIAQEAMLRIALANGDEAEAARRYAALFRNQDTSDTLLTALAPQVLGAPRGPGQATFAGVIAAAPLWHALFLQRGVRVMPAAAFAEILVTAADQGAQFDCPALRNTAEGLRQRDAAAAGKLAQVLARRCS